MDVIVDMVEAYAEREGVAPSTVCRLAAGSGNLHDRLRRGRGITVTRADRVVCWLSDHWPPDLPWPMGVSRPAPSPGAPAESGGPPPATRAEAERRLAAAVEARSAALTAEGPDGRLDWPAVRRAAMDGLLAAGALGPDGRVRWPGLLCRHPDVGVSMDVYRSAVRRYGGAGRGVPRPGTEAARLVEALSLVGDVRFRRLREAA